MRKVKTFISILLTFCILTVFSSLALAASPNADDSHLHDTASSRSGLGIIDFTCPNCGGIGVTIDGYYGDSTYTWVFECDQGHIWFVTEYVGILREASKQ